MWRAEDNCGSEFSLSNVWVPGIWSSGLEASTFASQAISLEQFLSSTQSRSPAKEWCHLQWAGLFVSINGIKIIPQRHAQSCITWVTPTSVN